MEIDNGVYTDFYDFIDEKLKADKVDGGRLLLLDEAVLTSVRDGLFKGKFELNTKTLDNELYGYDLVLSREGVVLNQVDSIRSRLNYLYHLMTIEGLIGIEFKVSCSAVSQQTIVALVDDETNLEICSYQEFSLCQNCGERTIMMILKAA